MKEMTLLIGHGSRDEDGNQEFMNFVDRVRANCPNRHIEACYLELAEPDIATGVRTCVEKGAERIIAIPLILLAASHVKEEIPEFLDAAREEHPNVDIVYGRNVGLHDLILDMLVDNFGETAIAKTGDAENTAIVLMGRGSSDPDANGDVYKIARLLWERTGVKTVETCFTGITTPLVPAGVARAVALGAKRIVVLPYFLFTGVLIKRMTNLLPTLQQTYPDIDLEMAVYFGFHPSLTDVVIDRIAELEVEVENVAG